MWSLKQKTADFLFEILFAESFADWFAVYRDLKNVSIILWIIEVRKRVASRQTHLWSRLLQVDSVQMWKFIPPGKLEGRVENEKRFFPCYWQQHCVGFAAIN